MAATDEQAEQPKAMDALTDKQKVFVWEYVGSCRWNATAAAKKAGYSVHTAQAIATENLQKPLVRAAIDEVLASEAMTAKEVLSRLRDHAAADMDELLDDAGQFDLEKARRLRKTHLIKEYSCEVETTLAGTSTVSKRKVKLHDAQAALVQIGRHFKLFTDNVDVTSDGKPLSKLTDAELIARATSAVAGNGEAGADASAAEEA